MQKTYSKEIRLHTQNGVGDGKKFRNYFKHHKKERKMKYYFMLLNMELCLWYAGEKISARVNMIVFTQGALFEGGGKLKVDEFEE